MNKPTRSGNGGIRIVLLTLLLAGLMVAGWLFLGSRKQSAGPQKAATPSAPPPVSSERQLYSGHGKMESVTFSPDGKVLGAIGEEKNLYLLDAVSGAIVQQISDACCTMSSVAFSPDGTEIAIGMNDTDGANIRVLRAGNGKFQVAVREIRERGNLVHSVAFSHDGKQLLTEIDAHAVLWNLETGAENKRFEAGVNGVCALSSDQATLITAGSNETSVKLWDVANGSPRIIFTGHTEGLLSVAISPDGTAAASGGYDFTARLWDSRTGDGKQVLKHREADAVVALAFSHSGSALATASDAVRIWNTATGAQDRLFPRSNITSLAYSSDDNLLAGVSRDGNLYLWQLHF